MLRLSHLDQKCFICLSIWTNTNKIIRILTMHIFKNNLWLWLGQNPFFKKFSLFPQLSKNESVKYLWVIAANLLFHILKFEDKIYSWLSNNHICYILKCIYIHKHTCMYMYIFMQFCMPNYSVKFISLYFILIRIAVIYLRIVILSL